MLGELLEAERGGDLDAIAATGLTGSESFPLHLDAASRADLLKDVYMSVSAEGGRLLYLLARATGARTVVEYGTSLGISAIYLAAAVRDNGGGRVIGTEIQPEKAARANRSFAAAGLAEEIELRVGDARETLRELDGPVDLLLLDGWPDLGLDVLRVVEPALRPGSLVLVDDVEMNFGADVHGPLLEYLAGDGYVALRLPMADGIQVAVKL